MVLNDKYKAISLLLFIYQLLRFYDINLFYKNDEIKKEIDDKIILPLLYIFGCGLLILIR